jgi:hypothetical protein
MMAVPWGLGMAGPTVATPGSERSSSSSIWKWATSEGPSTLDTRVNGPLNPGPNPFASSS